MRFLISGKDLKEMTLKTKRLLFGTSIIALIAAIAGGIYYFYENQKREQFIYDTLKEYSKTAEFVNISSKNWDNTIWIDSSINRNEITAIHFVEDYNHEGDVAWLFDGMTGYFNKGEIYMIVGESIRITGTMNGAFAGLENLVTIDGFDRLDTSNVTDMSYLFQKCKKLEKIDFTNFETDSLVLAKGMFLDCASLSVLDLSKNNMSSLKDAESMFENCHALDEIYLPSTPSMETARRMFYKIGTQSGSGTTIYGGLDTTNCKDIGYIVAESMIVNLDFMQNINTENVENAEYAFYNSSLPSEFDLSSWKTSKIKNMNNMLSVNPTMRKCNLNGWDVSSLEQCEYMFFYNSGMRELQIQWNNAKNVAKAQSMFKRCFSLEVLDLSSFNNIHFGDARELFAECENLKILYVENLNADVSDDMFKYCGTLNGELVDDFYDIEFGKANNFFSGKE